MALKIYLSDYLVPEEEFIMAGFSITDEIGNKKPFASDIEFFGQARQMIIDQIVNTQNPILCKIPCFIYWNDSLEITAEISGKDIEFSKGDCIDEDICGINCKILEKKRPVDYFKEHLAFKGIEEFNQPLVYMNPERDEFVELVTKILQFLVLVTIPVTLPVLLIIQVINTIISAINKIPGIKLKKIDLDQNPDTSGVDDIIGFYEDLVLGLDRIYNFPSPYVRTYIENALIQIEEPTGQTFAFVSSVLNDPSSQYYNLSYFNGINEEGNINSTRTIRANDLVKTMETVMEEICTVFNLEWRFVENVLYVEPSEFFERLGAEFDLSNECAVFNVRTVDYPATFKLGYEADFNDRSENFIEVDWNNPENTTQKGLIKTSFAFGFAEVGNFNGVFGNRNIETVLKIRSNKRSTRSKLLLMNSEGLLSEDQTPLWPENLLSFHEVKNPRNESFKKYEINFDLELCDYTSINLDSKVIFENQNMKIERITKEYEPEGKVQVSGLIGKIDL